MKSSPLLHHCSACRTVLALAILTVAIAPMAHAQGFTWIAATSNTTWETATAWSPSGVPGAGDIVIGPSNSTTGARWAVINGNYTTSSINMTNVQGWTIRASGNSNFTSGNLISSVTITNQGNLNFVPDAGVILNLSFSNIFTSVGTNGNGIAFGFPANPIGNLTVSGAIHTRGQIFINSTGSVNLGLVADSVPGSALTAMPTRINLMDTNQSGVNRTVTITGITTRRGSIAASGGSGNGTGNTVTLVIDTGSSDVAQSDWLGDPAGRFFLTTTPTTPPSACSMSPRPEPAPKRSGHGAAPTPV